MRQGQQNRRMRGRNNNGGGSNNNNNGGNNNNNNRRGPNPLTRSYESNGPDVKVRGTAQNIAEKYLTLARDAQSSGDRVMAENYLQHAEHYNRIIAAALAQQQHFQRDSRDEEEDEGPGENVDSRFDDVKHAHPVAEEQPEVRVQFDDNSPQPVIESQPSEDAQPASEAVARESSRAPRENNRPRRERTPRAPREPREPRIAVDADGDAPAEDGLLATLSRGSDKPVPVTADE
ncbi:MAG: DUF4167 domain-containing protein [Rhizobiaceae bacterium]